MPYEPQQARTVGETENDIRVARSKLDDVLRGTADDPMQMADRLSRVQASKTANEKTDINTHRTADMENTANAYKSVSAMVGQLNESYNANEYINRMLKKEIDRVSSAASSAQSQVYMQQQRHLSTTFEIGYKKFVTGIMVFTLAVTMLVCMLIGLWRQHMLTWNIFFTVCVIVLTVYTVIMAVLFGNTAKRRRYHWNQYYWARPGHLKNEQCKHENSISFR